MHHNDYFPKKADEKHQVMLIWAKYNEGRLQEEMPHS